MIANWLLLTVIAAIGTQALHLNNYRTKSKFTPRIYGGNKVEINQFPYFASLRTIDVKPAGFKVAEHFCGGAIIKDRWILTAAHCKENLLRSDSVIVVGANNSRDDGVIYRIQDIIVPELYKLNPGLLNSDIALVKLRDRIEFNENVQPIDLNEEWIGGNLDANVCGFGFEEDGEISYHLKYTQLKTLSTPECRHLNGHKMESFVYSTTLCTLADGSGIDHGDSGSPLVIDGRLVGITSWAVSEDHTKPNQFTRISSFIGWIEEQILASDMINL